MQVTAIYGPPGTGKTQRLMDIIEALKKSGHGADDIGFLSFTKAAASEALSRLGIKRSDKISTIHGAAFRLLGLSTAQVVDNHRLTQFCDLMGVPFRGGNVEEGSNIEVGDEYLALIGLAANRLETVMDTYRNSNMPGNGSEFEVFASTYRKWKDSNGYMDFADMLSAFAAAPVPFGASAVLVDEAQDLSPLQWCVIDELVKGATDVYIAGDDDQSIYVWGGADPAGMVAFEKKYNAKRIILDQSWRIPAAVHALSTRIIDQVENRVEKAYKPRDEVGVVEYHSHISSVELPEEGSIMILFRNHAIRREIEKDLIARRTPYATSGGLSGLYENRFAYATRAFQKLKRGESIAEDELNTLFNVASKKAKQQIAERDFASLTATRQHIAIEYPVWMTDFYCEADLFAPVRVKLSSIHSSKGREADTVVLYLSMTTSTYDGYMNDPDSEHRVFYVGATRAKHNLIVVDGFNPYEIPR